MWRRWGRGKLSGEDGFTLQEILVAIVVMGILTAIGIIIWLGILERWRVEAATNQLVADLRLAHTNASNQLTDWRVVSALDRVEEDEGPDYYLVKLASPYPGATPAPVKRTPRYFPGNVQVTNVITSGGSLTDNQGAAYWAAPWDSPSPSPMPSTRTLEFNSDGTMTFFVSPAGSLCVNVDDSPKNRVVARASTSRIRIESNSDCNTAN